MVGGWHRYRKRTAVKARGDAGQSPGQKIRDRFHLAALSRADLGLLCALLLRFFGSLAMAELLTAVDRGDASALQPLLESRADPEACGSDGRSALVCACLANNLPVAK